MNSKQHSLFSRITNGAKTSARRDAPFRESNHVSRSLSSARGLTTARSLITDQPTKMDLFFSPVRLNPPLHGDWQAASTLMPKQT